MNKTIIKKQFIAFLIIAAYILGSIGGLGMVLWCKEYVIAVGLAVVVWLAFPKVKEYYKVFIE
jgi:hypothetical protein